jgi:predicted RNA-binding Zn ribbon-like protein
MPSSAGRRPHVGEPLALDLLNTEFMRDGTVADYLGELSNVQGWLDDNGLPGRATSAVRANLVESRAAIRAVLTGRDRGGRARLNAVLSHGSVRLSLTEARTSQRDVEVDDPAWRPAVLAAVNLLELLDTVPGRIRNCEHPHCVLWFLDTSRNGTRRWHSMTTCGNRAKAQRHYARSRRSDNRRVST